MNGRFKELGDVHQSEKAIDGEEIDDKGVGEDNTPFGAEEEDEDDDDSFSLGANGDEEDEEPPSIDFGVDGVTGVIVDLQGKFNLNNLANEDRAFVVSQRRILQNLMELLELGEFADRDQLIENLIDWVDENSTSRSIGLESNDYRVKDLPYQAADQKLAALGELRFIDGFNQDIIKALEPHVTVLPVDNARININTTTTEVLASLSSTTVADVASVDTFLSQRLNEDFLGFQAAQIRDAENAIIAVSPVRQPPIANTMQVTSQYFEIQSRVELGDIVYCMNSLILRGGAAAQAGLVAQGQSAGEQLEASSSVPAISVLRREHSSFCEDQSQIIIQESDEDFSET